MSKDEASWEAPGPLRKLLISAQLLLQNAEGCAANHYGRDIELNGLPGWLADCKADIEAGAQAILRSDLAAVVQDNYRKAFDDMDAILRELHATLRGPEWSAEREEIDAVLNKAILASAPKPPVPTVHQLEIESARNALGRTNEKGRYIPVSFGDRQRLVKILDGLVTPKPPANAGDFQSRVGPWMRECFGPEISGDIVERNHRFLEESLELVQARGCTRSEAHQLVDYTFDRPAGDPEQETGGVMVTLAALCLAAGIDMHHAGERELARIWGKIKQIRAKQAAKPKHSPLPQANAGDEEIARLKRQIYVLCEEQDGAKELILSLEAEIARLRAALKEMQTKWAKAEDRYALESKAHYYTKRTLKELRAALASPKPAEGE